MNYFTSDLHFNHAKICDYTKRPWKEDVEKMNSTLINNINSRVKPSDTLYHVGDFAFKGGWQGGKEAAQHFEDRINCKVIHVLGNHDRNNHIKNSIRYAEMWFGNKRWCLQHHPPEPRQLRRFPYAGDTTTVYLVGHVHEAWKHKWVEDFLVINVGTDVWNYRPINTSEIVVYADRCIKRLTKGIDNAK
jgi:calcineurin-like phosphoesterase family protein